MSTLRVAKNALRQQMKLKLKKIAPTERSSQSEAVFKKILELPEFLAAKKISVYVSTPTEIGTETLIRHMLQQGKQVYIPRYRSENLRSDAKIRTGISDFGFNFFFHTGKLFDPKDPL